MAISIVKKHWNKQSNENQSREKKPNDNYLYGLIRD